MGNRLNKNPWQSFVGSFDHEANVRSACHPAPVATLVVLTVGMALACYYIPVVQRSVELRNWVIPSALVATGGLFSILGWLAYPNRNLVALSQLLDIPFYGAATISLAALSDGIAVYVFTGIWTLACFSYASKFALTAVGTLSCLSGACLVALILGLPALAWVMMLISYLIYIFTARVTSSRRSQIARYARSGEVLERIDQLLENQNREIVLAVHSHTTSLLHEAKNELTPASWNLDLISKRDDLTEEERLALSESKASIDETLQAIQGILEKTPAEAIEETTFWLPDLGPLLDLENADAPMKQAIRIGDLPEVTLRSPTEYLRIAICNLVDNAIEAGAGEVAITGRVMEDDPSVVISIVDDGPGVPEQVQEGLFKPFNTHGKEGGVGLGIYLSRRLIDAAGGELRLATTGAEGTVWELELPCQDVK